MLRIIYLLLFSSITLLGLDIDDQSTYNALLPHCEIYIDHNKSTTIDNIKGKDFQPNDKKAVGFGYSPDFTVWVKFTLSNTSSTEIHKLIEYDNPLTSHVTFFDNATLLYQGGLLHAPKEKSLHPTLAIRLKPYESKMFYLKASSSVTTMIVKLNLWNPDTFYKKEIRYQFILALFFGAMGVVILYNFIVFFMTHDRSYLYYVLFFVGITVHHLIYRGIAHLYILSPAWMTYVIEHSIFIVAFPAFFLALFMKEVLNLKQHKTINMFLNAYLVLFPFLVLFFYLSEYENARNTPTMILLLIILVILIMMMVKRNKHAYYMATGWFLFISSAIAMQLSSMGKYDIFATYPYYSEFTLVVEAVLFSLILSSHIKELNHKNTLANEKLIEQQEKEEIRLTKLVEEKTSALTKSLDQKQFLLKELNHRVKNNLQTILSFVRLQANKASHQETYTILDSLKHRIFAVYHLHTLLHQKENGDSIDVHEYFSMITHQLKESFQMPNIEIHIDTEVTLSYKSAIISGHILNEALTNAYQHAFSNDKDGEIFIKMFRIEKEYTLSIQDTGIGYVPQKTYNTLGLSLIENLATIQLDGTLNIDSSHGTLITIVWEEDRNA